VHLVIASARAVYRIVLRWPASRIETHVISADKDDLSIDILHAPATERAQHLLLVTTGEHGIEGFVGSAIMELVIRKILPTLDPTTTSLCLVHAINPWGMKHGERTNAANVDLNRNFVTSWDPRHRPTMATAACAPSSSRKDPCLPCGGIACSSPVK